MEKRKKMNSTKTRVPVAVSKDKISLVQLESNTTYLDYKILKDKVVKHIQDYFMLNDKLIVQSNLFKDNHFIGGIFPDIILLDKESGKANYVIEVRVKDEIANCIQKLNTISHMPISLYLVISEDDEKIARSIAEVIGAKIRFGVFKENSEGQITVTYD